MIFDGKYTQIREGLRLGKNYELLMQNYMHCYFVQVQFILLDGLSFQLLIELSLIGYNLGYGNF